MRYSSRRTLTWSGQVTQGPGASGSLSTTRIYTDLVLARNTDPVGRGRTAALRLCCCRIEPPRGSVPPPPLRRLILESSNLNLEWRGRPLKAWTKVPSNCRIDNTQLVGFAEYGVLEASGGP